MAQTTTAVRTFPLVLVLTMALLGAMTVAGVVLLGVLDTVYSQQIRSNLEAEAERQADYLSETFSRMLWIFDLQSATAVAAAVARDESILVLDLVTEQGRTVYHYAKPGGRLITLQRDLTFQGLAVGTLTLTMTRGTLDNQRAEVASVALAALAGLLAVLAILAPVLLNQTVLRPFNRLSRALVNEEGVGPFPDLPEPSSTIREVRTLETALATLNRAVARQVDDLEARVVGRSRALEEAQALLVRSETLATLGQLAAGIAHELNTPLGAILSSVRLLQEEWTDTLLPLLASVVAVPSQLDSELFLREVAFRAAQLDDYPDAPTRRSLMKRWTAAGRHPDSPLCDLACSSGVSTLLDDLVLIPDGHPAQDVVVFVGQWGRSLAIIASATDKGASVVQALRAQVQPSTVNEAQPVELRREMGQTLSLMQSKLRGGVHVTVQGPPEVWVLGDAKELSKVWLNLVLNAVQAMDGTGTLDIRFDAGAEFATVAITDSGPGIPPEVLPRIWEPFYTTKPTGMGLGLEITKRIVEQNLGTIDVETVPGRTTFRVRLPSAGATTP